MIILGVQPDLDALENQHSLFGAITAPLSWNAYFESRTQSVCSEVTQIPQLFQRNTMSSAHHAREMRLSVAKT